METVSSVRVFISYAWEDDEYREWVRSLATQLIQDGVDVRLDHWDLEEGDTIAGFMNREERHADKVLVLCSPMYRTKVHEMEEGKRVTGTGWESRLLTSSMFQRGLTDKALPVLARGAWEEAAPSFLADYPYTDLTVSDEQTLKQNYNELLRRILGIREEKPSLGSPPLEKLASKPAPPFFRDEGQRPRRVEQDDNRRQPEQHPSPSSHGQDELLDEYLDSEERIWCLLLTAEAQEKKKVLLLDTVEAALEKKWRQISDKTPVPTPVPKTVTEVLATPEAFTRFVRYLCKAEFAVFDMTNYEPAMMLLIGLRAVIKRGVTVVTVNHALPPEKWVEIPFSLKQISPIAHEFSSNVPDPVDLMAETFAEGWRQLHAMPHYLDLPAYDDVRLLGTKPQDYAPIPWHRAMLWLCSFGKKYLKKNYHGRMPTSFRSVFGERARQDEIAKEDPKINLITDITSPRLMSQRTYEAIRRHELCVVDWTEWRANVFFEFGVRLAVSDKDPVSIFDPTLDASIKVDSHGLGQVNLLKKLFGPHEYDGQLVTRGNFEPACQKWLQQASNGSLGYGAVFNEISRVIDIDRESASRPLHKELLDSANRMTGDDDRMAGSFPTLYSTKNDTLKQRAKQGAWERQLATWLFFHELWKTDPGRIREDDQLREDIEELATRMLLRLYDDPQLDKNDLMEKIENLLNEIETSHVNGEGNA